MKVLITIFYVTFLTVTTKFSKALSMPLSSKGTPLPLGKESTPQDVYETLKKNNRLASYVNTDDGGNINLDDRPIAVVTGGSSGIGIPSIEALVSLANMKVVLCARNLDAAKEAVMSLPKSIRSSIRIQKMDLSDMNSVDKAAKEIIETEGKIDVLLNNAGVMATPKRISTAQGLELQFGTNHVGHHMLTRMLLPIFSREGRIVTVASSAHSMGNLDFENLNYDEKNGKRRKYTGWGAYGQSKLSNILFAKGLSNKLKEKTEDGVDANNNIKSVSLHPGVIGTNLWRHTPKWTKPILNAFMTDRNVEQGAATNIYCCLIDNAEFENGGEYLSDCQVIKPKNESGKDDASNFSNQLWKATEEIIKEKGFDLPKDLLGSR